MGQRRRSGTRAAPRRVRFEDVRERAPQIRQRRGRGEHGHGAAGEHVEAAHLVEAHDVVGVRVGKEHRVDTPDVLA